jgi:signal transduction histidine kinase
MSAMAALLEPSRPPAGARPAAAPVPAPAPLADAGPAADADVAAGARAGLRTGSAGATGLRQHAPVVAVLTTGLSALVAIEGPREWGVFLRVLLPVLALTLVGTFTAARAVGGRAAARWHGYPLWCAFGGIAGGSLGICVSAAWRGRSLQDIAARPIALHLVAGSLVTGTLVGIAFHWLERTRRQERRRERALFAVQAELLRSRTAAAEAEAARIRMSLQLLQAQVEPHFLYIALANLRYLVRHDAALAQQLVDHLVRYFRVALPSLRELEVTLAQELELCSAFAAIQAMRLGERLRVEFDVAPEWHDVRLPPALLLTLLENAFKHGMPADGGPAHVRVAAAGCGGILTLSVTDNGAGPVRRPGDGAPSAGGSGIGVKWLAERLRAVFGERASLSLEAAPGRGCRAVLLMPVERGDA